MTIIFRMCVILLGAVCLPLAFCVALVVHCTLGAPTDTAPLTADEMENGESILSQHQIRAATNTPIQLAQPSERK